MTYTPYTWIDDPAGGTPITAARLNAIEQGIAAASTGSGGAGGGAASSFVAPNPSGGDDSAVLQALINQASAIQGGTVILQAGTYLCNLVTPDNYYQPLIVGQGRYATTLKAFSSASAVIKFRGGSGVVAGSGLRSLRLLPANSGGGVAIHFSGADGVECRDIAITGSSTVQFAEAIRFHNEENSDFTEFDVFEGNINNVNVAVRYLVENGVESFHGSGLVGETVVSEVSGTVIQIDTGIGLPYNAPLNGTFFLTAGKPFIVNGNTAGGRHASFYGHLKIEAGAGNTLAINGLSPAANNKVLYAGEITWLGGGAARLGNLYLVDKVNYDNSTINVAYKPLGFASFAASSVSYPIPAGNSSAFLLNVTITAANYHKQYILTAWQSPYNPGGNVTTIATPFSNDTVGWGNPTFTWANYGLTIANANYNSSTAIYVGVTPLGGGIGNFLYQ